MPTGTHPVNNGAKTEYLQSKYFFMMKPKYTPEDARAIQ